MTSAQLVNTCPVCGAEESLDAMLHRMIQDDEARRLIYEVITRSFVLGGHVARYLRLHKPAKHKLSIHRVAVVLGELVPAITAERINRKGRDWTVTESTWKAAFSAGRSGYAATAWKSGPPTWKTAPGGFPSSAKNWNRSPNSTR